MARNDIHEKAWKRAIPLLAAAIPLIVSTLLFAQLARRYGQPLTTLVSTHRTTTQTIVQILSHGLGYLQVYSLRAGQKFATRLQLFRASTRLEQMAFLLAISTGQIDTSLSTKHVFFSGIALATCIIPGALWAGALTPILIESQLKTPGMQIAVPAYTQSSTAYWDAEFEISSHRLWNHVNYCQSSGTVTTCPVPGLQGLLLGSAASATTSDNSVRKHDKLDSAGWSYSNRSYGIGASIGNTQATNLSGAAQLLSYSEYGYVTQVDCIYNTSSAYALSLSESSLGPTKVNLYNAHGFLPNSFDNSTAPTVRENYVVISTWSDYENILAWSARSINGRNYIALATGKTGNYTEFDQTQCEVKFEPSAFNVTANLTSKSITVQPKALPANSSSSLLDKKITVNTINSINLLSRMSGSLYTSVLGDALTRNLNNKMTAVGSTNATHSIVLASLEESFMAISDDILGAYGAAQVVLAEDVTYTALLSYGMSVKVGGSIYTILVLAMSSLIVVFQLFEMLRTRFWADLLLFDVYDTKSVIVAASAGGKEIADQLINTGETDGRASQVSSRTVNHHGLDHNWLGAPDDKVLGRLNIRFCGPKNFGVNRIPVVVAADRMAGSPLEYASTNFLVKNLVVDGTVTEVSGGDSYLLRDWSG